MVLDSISCKLVATIMPQCPLLRQVESIYLDPSIYGTERYASDGVIPRKMQSLVLDQTTLVRSARMAHDRFPVLPPTTLNGQHANH